MYFLEFKIYLIISQSINFLIFIIQYSFTKNNLYYYYYKWIYINCSKKKMIIWYVTMEKHLMSQK